MTENLEVLSEQTDQIEFHRNITDQVPSSSKDNLDTVKAKLRKGKASPGDAKFLLANRLFLFIPETVMTYCITTLAKHYGLEEATVATMELQRDVIACVEVERFELDAAAALEEYRQINWQEEFAPYVRYSSSDLRISFGTFIEACKAAIVYQKGQELTAQAHAEAKRILDMNPEEWQAYNREIKWSQAPHAEDKRREGLVVANWVLEPTRFIEGLTFVKADQQGTVLTELFSKFQTTQSLSRKSKLLVPSYFDAATSKPPLSLDYLLRPLKGSKA